MAALSIDQEDKAAPDTPKIDLTPLHQGELPVLQKLFTAVTASEDRDASSLWNEMLEEFGKYRVLNLKVGGFINYNYSTVTRLIKVLARLGLAEVYEEQLDRLKIEIGARFPILLLHDIGGTLIYRENKKPVGPNGEKTDKKFFKTKSKYVYVRPGASEYIKRLQSHPRVIFGFYSSIVMKYIEKILS